MKYYLFIVFCILACGKEKSKIEDRAKMDFKTRPDSELFFKNVRQIYYQLENQVDTKLHLYRFKTRSQSQQKPILNLIIVHNWRFNEAYLLLEPNSFLQKINPLEIHWQNKSGKMGKYIFKAGNKNTHFEFAFAIYQSLLANNQLFILENKQKIPILDKQTEREVFRISILDYLRLIGKNQVERIVKFYLAIKLD